MIWLLTMSLFPADVIINSNLPYSEFKVLYFAIYEGDVGRIVNSISSASPLKPSSSFFAFQEENNQRIWFVKELSQMAHIWESSLTWKLLGQNWITVKATWKEEKFKSLNLNVCGENKLMNYELRALWCISQEMFVTQIMKYVPTYILEKVSFFVLRYYHRYCLFSSTVIVFLVLV